MENLIDIELQNSFITVKLNGSQFEAFITHTGELRPIRYNGKLGMFGALVSVAQEFISAGKAGKAYIVEHLPAIEN